MAEKMKIIVKNDRTPLDAQTLRDMALDLHAGLDAEMVRNVLGSSIVGVNKREPYTLDSMAAMSASLDQRSLKRVIPDREELAANVRVLSARKLLWVSPAGEIFPTYLPKQVFSSKPGVSEHEIPLPVPSPEEFSALTPDGKQAFRQAVFNAVFLLPAKGNILWVPRSLPVGSAVADEYISHVREGIDAQLAAIEKTGAFSREEAPNIPVLAAVALEVHRRNLKGEPVSPPDLTQLFRIEHGWSEDRVKFALMALADQGLVIFAPHETDRTGKKVPTLCTVAFLLRDEGSQLLPLGGGAFLYLPPVEKRDFLDAG